MKKTIVEAIWKEKGSFHMFIDVRHPCLEINKDKAKGIVLSLVFNKKTVADMVFEKDYIVCTMSFNLKKMNVKIPYNCMLLITDSLKEDNSVNVEFKPDFNEPKKQNLKLI